MRIRSFLHSSVALLATVSLGQAADLPSKKAAAVDYVKVCSIGSFTGFVLPGSDTCVKMGGFVRTDTVWDSPTCSGEEPGTGRKTKVLTPKALASLKMDARSNTEMGLLRGTYDIRIDQAGGAKLDKGYVQLGGFAAGKMQSLFDFYADDASISNVALGSDHSAVAVTYTASLAGGFYGAVSLEDGVPTHTLPDATVYGGQRKPNLIAAVGLDQSWGSVKLSGVLSPLYTSRYNTDSLYGYAVQAGAKLNLPFLGDGDALFLQAAYANGAVGYLGVPSASVGHLKDTKLDSIYNYSNDVLGNVTTVPGFNVTAALEHSFSSKWGMNVFGGYTLFGASKGFDSTSRKAGIIQAGTNVTWKPVSNLKIAAEVAYTDVKLDRPVQVSKDPARSMSSDYAVQTVLRVQRDF
jgi:hypothetical protein